MLIIKNDEQLRMFYNFLNLCNKDKEKNAKAIKLFKRAIRCYNQKQLDIINYRYTGNYTFHFDFDYKVAKHVYYWLFSERDEEEYIRENWLNYYSWYDCSGLWFTSDIVFCRVPAEHKTIVLEYYSLDC
jgi:hypothetical protein